MTYVQLRIERHYLSTDELCPFADRVYSGHVENPCRVQILNVHFDPCLDDAAQRLFVQYVPVCTIVSAGRSCLTRVAS